ncbi:MAG: HAD family phosphatase [Pseudomonadota bacterium]
MNVVFDFGAVLFTWQPLLLVQKYFPTQAQTSESASQLAHAMFKHDDWKAFDHGTLALDEVVARTAARIGLPHDAVNGMISCIADELQPIDSNIGLLTRLREQRDGGADDIRLFYLSNMPVPYARTLEQRHDFLNWFDGGIFSGDVNLGKPDLAIFELLAARHGLQAADTIFIDDTLANVQAAHQLGWQAIHCEDPEALTGQLDALMR